MAKSLLTVTFDSNVWEKVVDPDKREADDETARLYEAVTTGRIMPFMFEGVLTLEAVPKDSRSDYFLGYRPTITARVNGNPAKVQLGTSAPVLTEYLMVNVPRAIELGFRLLRLPRVGMAIGPSEWAAAELFYSLGERLDRSAEFARFVESLALSPAGLPVGEAASYGVDISTKKFADHIAECVDADALAAHYGYGIDIFCTRDLGRKKPSTSVLSPPNLKRIAERFPICVCSPAEVVDLLGRSPGQE